MGGPEGGGPAGRWPAAAVSAACKQQKRLAGFGSLHWEDRRALTAAEVACLCRLPPPALPSADDLRVNLWNLDIADQSFNIVDIKPQNMEDLTEVGCGVRWLEGGFWGRLEAAVASLGV